MNLNLAYLYPDQMNIYGDRGNIEALIYRAKKRQIKINLIKVNPNSLLKTGSFDLLFAGGGQDRHQATIHSDLRKKAQVIKKASLYQVPMLTICGSYQLFGTYFKPLTGSKLKGINIFNAYTIASPVRKIGNIVIKTNFLTPSTLVGFENHSGLTFISNPTKPLGTIISGHGNNDQDQLEGAIINNVYGCYLHGSLLPKNPHFTDHLLQLALNNKYSQIKLTPLNDTLEWQAHHSAVKIPLFKKPGWWNW